MKSIGLFLFVLVLFNFGLTVTGDAVKSTSHVEGYSSIPCDGHESNNANTECMDPCHTGFGHLGHSFATLNESQVFLLNLVTFLIVGESSDTSPSNPYLDGPRRPPRTS